MTGTYQNVIVYSSPDKALDVQEVGWESFPYHCAFIMLSWNIKWLCSHIKCFIIIHNYKYFLEMIYYSFPYFYFVIFKKAFAEHCLSCVDCESSIEDVIWLARFISEVFASSSR